MACFHCIVSYKGNNQGKILRMKLQGQSGVSKNFSLLSNTAEQVAKGIRKIERLPNLRSVCFIISGLSKNIFTEESEILPLKL